MIKAGCIFPDIGLDIDPDAGHLVAAPLGKANLWAGDKQHNIIAIGALEGTKEQQLCAVLAAGDLDIVLREIGDKPLRGGAGRHRRKHYPQSHH